MPSAISIRTWTGCNTTSQTAFAILVYGSHNDFQQTNAVGEFLPEGVGGVTELLKNRVIIPFEGDYELFRHVIQHELTHAIVNEYVHWRHVSIAAHRRRNGNSELDE